MANLYNLVRSTWTASNPSLANGIISLPGVYDANLGTTKTVSLEYNAIKKVKFAEGAAATAGVVTVVITATAANPSIIGAEILDQGGNLAVTNTTPGVKAIGAGADLIAAGISEAVTGQSYDIYVVTYKTFKADGDVDSVSERLDTITLYIDETAGTTSGAYGSGLDTILNGGSTTANYLDVMTS